MKETPYERIAAVIDDWCQRHYYDTMLVTLSLRYDCEKIAEITTQILDFDINADGYWVWENDWWEGQQNVELLGFAPLSQIEIHSMGEPVVQQEAEWTHTFDPRCSRCNNFTLPGWDEVPFQSRFCPHCGARMKNPDRYE